MAKDQGVKAPAARTVGRPVKGTSSIKPVTAAPVAAPVEAKKRVSPTQFLKEVRVEARKITWTSWKETWITSVMVGIMVVVTAVFFLVVDWGLGLFIQQILKLAV